jgi:hypothetical protein
MFRRKTPNITAETIDTIINQAPISEEMIRRDNFFHSCWMIMKQKHPEFCEEMSEIELFIAGYVKEDKEEPEEETEDNGIVL